MSILFMNKVYGQNAKIDSIKVVLECKTGIDKFESMISLIHELSINDNQTALSFAKEAVQLAFINTTAEIKNLIKTIHKLFELAFQEVHHSKVKEYVKQKDNLSQKLKSVIDKLYSYRMKL